MSFLGDGFKALFLLTSASSALGFGYAASLHESAGPTRRIVDFSVFMAYSFCLYLLACLGSTYFCAASGQRLLPALLLSLFCLPFVLAFFARSYERARTVFSLQIIGLIAGAAALVCLDPAVRQMLRRLV